MWVADPLFVEKFLELDHNIFELELSEMQPVPPFLFVKHTLNFTMKVL
jgi:hypothetical protein